MLAADLARIAIGRGYCSAESLAAAADCAGSTIRCYLAGHRQPPGHLLRTLLRHVSPVQRRELLELLADDVGAAPAHVVVDLQLARQVVEARDLADQLARVLDCRRAA